MASTFFSRPVRIFGKVSILIICLVLFAAPFAIRGARLSLQRMQNNVKDWLPDDFPETRELRWFSRYFLGEQFILATWPGCTAADARYRLLVQKLQGELAPLDPAQELEQARAAAGDDPQQQAAALERVRTRQLGDSLGLLSTGDYQEDWGGQQERWLQGRGGGWYFITPDGQLHEWTGAATLPAFLWRSAQRLLQGRHSLTGKWVATLGRPGTPQQMNEFYADPRKLGARLFHTLTTGPQVVELLAKEHGPLWPLGQEVAEEAKPAEARRTARERLTGVLFGPALPAGFSWDQAAVLAQIPPEMQPSLPVDWQATLTAFVDRVVAEDYGGDRSGLVGAGPSDQTRHWEMLFQRLGMEPPPRQTCLVLTLSELGKQDLRRTIGRPMLGRPPGKLQQLATGESGIDPDALKLGGPPVDNVAIDEEGTVTLYRLIGLSGLLGITLAWLCFRSFSVTLMVFFVGGLSAVSSLAIVWWTGASVDAILLSMPSLVYVLGLSGAVHIINYYQEAVANCGLEGAPERALAHGWGPTTFCAFTTALGLGSLCVSNLAPIQKFGFFSAISVLATLLLLFAFLPAALEVFPPKTARAGRRTADSTLTMGKVMDPFWTWFGGFIVRRHRWVAAGCLLLSGLLAIGLPRLNTSIQLLKLFDAEAKIIRDYAWLETHLGKLVPMELVVRVPPELQRPSLEELQADSAVRDNARRGLAFWTVFNWSIASSRRCSGNSVKTVRASWARACLPPRLCPSCLGPAATCSVRPFARRSTPSWNPTATTCWPRIFCASSGASEPAANCGGSACGWVRSTTWTTASLSTSSDWSSNPLWQPTNVFRACCNRSMRATRKRDPSPACASASWGSASRGRKRTLRRTQHPTPRGRQVSNVSIKRRSSPRRSKTCCRIGDSRPLSGTTLGRPRSRPTSPLPRRGPASWPHWTL